jgi:hypothetical protein
MKTHYFITILGILSLLSFFFFSLVVADSESDILQFYLPLLVVPALVLFGIAFGLYLKAKKATNRTYQNDTSIENSQITNDTSKTLEIPENCPNCKNPNTKKIRLCEWCGGQIC